MAHQHEIQALKAGGLLHGQHIGRRFDHTQQRTVTARVGTQSANLGFAQIAAQPTMTDPIQRHSQRLDQARGPIAIPFQQMQRHPLRRLRPHSRQAA